MEENDQARIENRRKSSYRDKVMGIKCDVAMEGDNQEGDVSDDDDLEDEKEGPWFLMGMTREEKSKAMKPWRLSLIVKLVGHSTGYQFLLWR